MPPTITSRVLQCPLALLLLLITFHPEVLQAQLSRALQFELLRIQMSGRDSEKWQNGFRAWKLQERRNVPVYNARLNGALIEFHKHILKDEHYLVTNCGICRKYLSEIKSYSKKLEQAMK